MRICFISHSGYMGGAERALLEAIRALSKRGVICHVLLPYEGPICNELSRLGVAFRIVKYRPWIHKRSESWWERIKSFLISLIMVVPASYAIVRWRSTIVYTNTITIFTGALAALLTGRPHVWHIHEFGYEDHGLEFLIGKRLSLGLMNRLSVVCISISKAIASAYQEFIPPSKLKIIYQSVSISPSVMQILHKTNTFKCVIVGIISERKNQEEAVNAVAELVKKGKNIELYIIGDGYEDYTIRLKKIIQKEGIENNIQFTGYRNDAFGYMCMGDVVLMCSRAEGFGRATVEGMLAGKPVIGARAGATSELIKDGINGLLYTAGNYKELAQKIEYLNEHPNTARLMGENAREWALKYFSEDRYCTDLMQVLHNVVESDIKNKDHKSRQTQAVK